MPSSIYEPKAYCGETLQPPRTAGTVSTIWGIFPIITNVGESLEITGKDSKNIFERPARQASREWPRSLAVSWLCGAFGQDEL